MRLFATPQVSADQETNTECEFALPLTPRLFHDLGVFPCRSA